MQSQPTHWKAECSLTNGAPTRGIPFLNPLPQEEDYDDNKNRDGIHPDLY